MKVQLARIPVEGLQVSFDRDEQELDELLVDPRKEIRGATGGLRAELDIQRMHETIVVRGIARAHLLVNCVRCTAAQVMEVTADLDAVLMPADGSDGESNEEVELTENELDISFYEGDQIDLGPLVREAILLEMPQYPSCGTDRKEDCEKYMKANGARSNEMEAEPSMDLRWEKLRSMKAAMVKNGTN